MTCHALDGFQGNASAAYRLLGTRLKRVSAFAADWEEKSMKYSRTGSNRIGHMVAILAAMGMLWMGSTQFLPAQTVTTVAADSLGDRACSNAGVAGEWGYTET